MHSFKQHKKDFFEILGILAILVFLFFYFRFVSDFPYEIHLEYAFLMCFIIFKKIRKHLFSLEHIIPSFIMTALLMLLYNKTAIPNAGYFIVYLISFFIISKGFLALWESIKIGGYDEIQSDKKSPNFVFLEVFLAVSLSLISMWIYRYFPSSTSPDTFNQWDQIHNTIPFWDIHAPLHTLYMKLLISIWDSYAIVVLANIVMMAFLAGLFSKYLYQKGVYRDWLIIINVFFVFTKMSLFYMFPYKDIPYTFILGIITYMLMKMVDDGPKSKISYGILWGLVLTLCYFIRYNGIVCVAFILIYLLVLFIKKRLYKQMISLILSIVILSVSLNLFIYQVMGCEHKDNGFSLQVFGSGIAAVVANNGDITQEQLEKVDKILGIDWIEKYYQPGISQRLIWTAEAEDPTGFFSEPGYDALNNFFVVGMGENKMEIIKLYFSLLINNPVICFRDVIYNTFIIWRYDNVFSNIYLLLILASAMMVFGNSNDFKKSWIVFIPVLANIFSIAISTITNESRYLLPTFTLFIPLLFYITVSQKKSYY